MVTTSSVPGPTPERIFNTLNAYQSTAALKTAIEMDLFTVASGDDDNRGATSFTRSFNAGTNERFTTKRKQLLWLPHS